jgi:hypothetical protein
MVDSILVFAHLTKSEEINRVGSAAGRTGETPSLARSISGDAAAYSQGEAVSAVGGVNRSTVVRDPLFLVI